MDSADLRVEAILGNAFREVRVPPVEEPDAVCECGHVRDGHGPWRGCFECDCREFEEAS